MKLQGRDRLMILDRTTYTAKRLEGAYRIIDNDLYDEFVVKVKDPKTKKLSSRRYDRKKYGYSINRDPDWKPRIFRRQDAGV